MGPAEWQNDVGTTSATEWRLSFGGMDVASSGKLDAVGRRCVWPFGAGGVDSPEE